MKTQSFRTAAALETWLSANHDRETELWLKVHKKDSGLPSVTCPEALDAVSYTHLTLPPSDLV